MTNGENMKTILSDFDFENFGDIVIGKRYDPFCNVQFDIRWWNAECTLSKELTPKDAVGKDDFCRESTVKTTQAKIIQINRELEEGIYRFCIDELNYHINESRCAKEYDSEIRSQIELLKLLGYKEEATEFEQQYKEKNE